MSVSGKTLEEVGGAAVEDITDLPVGPDKIYIGATLEEILCDIIQEGDIKSIDVIATG